MPIIVDLIMMGLLIGVIIHSIRLSDSLKHFKKLHSELVPLMKEYANTVQSSYHQIDQMKKISGEVDHILQSRVPEALTIKGDLDFLTSRAEELADHLELLIRTGRNEEFTLLSKGPKQDLKKEYSTLKTQDETPVILKSPAEKRKTKKKQDSGFKPIVESFFLTKTAKKLLGKDRETNNAA